MIPWILLILLLLIYCATLPSLLQRAQLKSTLGFVPVVNFLPFLKMIKRPWWWIFLLLCPGVNLLVMIIMNVELGIAFGKRSTKDQWFFGALPWLALPMLAFKEKQQSFIGPRDWTGKKKGSLREWGEAIVFAIVAASVIRTFFIEAFTIPTPSMEKSMLVGDYLFVSKVSYGAKIPQTPVSVPFVHNAMPGSMTNSYVDWFSLPYFRLPGLGEVERFNPVVFNFPNGDSIMVDPYYAGHDYHSYLRKEAQVIAKYDYQKYVSNQNKYDQEARNNFKKGVCLICGLEQGYKKIGGVKARPMDKKENYVKRCIGLPGENLKIINGQVYINDAPIDNPAGLMLSYEYEVQNIKALKDIWEHCKVNLDDRKVLAIRKTNFGEEEQFYPYKTIIENKLEFAKDSVNFLVGNSSLNAEDVEWLKSNSVVRNVQQNIDSIPYDNSPFQTGVTMYPNNPSLPYCNWTQDNYGPIHIPYKGETIELNNDNVITYKRVITSYESNTLEQREGKVYINGVIATTYTFKQDYYWMMGDNRHNSADSRFWGFVPEDHVVGKPVFTWFSKSDVKYQPESEVRWKRMFRFVK